MTLMLEKSPKESLGGNSVKITETKLQFLLFNYKDLMFLLCL